MKKVTIVDQQAMSKPAEEVLKTAKADIEYSDWQTVYDTPFFKAFTKKELRDYLREFVFHTNDAHGSKVLKLKDCRIVKGEITDMDSTNLSHAGAYYAVWIELPASVVEGTSMAELIEEIA